MKKLLLLLTFSCFALLINAQDWTHRHKFAKTYIGLGNNFVFGLKDGHTLDSEGVITPFTRHDFWSPAINIGATHFWGYADFFVSINTAAIKFGEDDVKNRFALNTFTGLKIYPLPSTEKSVRPYVGYKFAPFSYSQTNSSDQSFHHTAVKSVFNGGVTFHWPQWYMTLDYSWVVNPKFSTYLSQNTKVEDHYPSGIVQLGINYMIETTSFANADEYKRANEEFGSSNQLGLFLAIGPSSAFPMASSSYLTDHYPFLNDKSFPTIFPDMALGYHFTKSDWITALSYRPMRQLRRAYGIEADIHRHSIIAEAYKFIGDYHGFVPYIGAGISYEKLKFELDDPLASTAPISENKVAPAVVFGWDIRPSVKGDWWILRTNLRYYPTLKIELGDEYMSLQHLEFNFIQFVFYPQRLKRFKAISST